MFEIREYIFDKQILKLAPMKNMNFSFLMLGSIKTTFGPLRSLTAMHIIWPLAILGMAYFVEYRQTFQKVENQENRIFVTNNLNWASNDFVKRI